MNIVSQQHFSGKSRISGYMVIIAGDYASIAVREFPV
jgi:hypothetical protein